MCYNIFMKKVIFLNAGHSEMDPGAKAPKSDFENESQINIAIRDFVVPELEEQGFDVIVISDDKTLSQSILSVNKATSNINDGLALDIHCNCCGKEGAEVYYYYGYEESKRIAEKLLTAYCEETGIKNNKARPDTLSQWKGLGWIRKTNVWSLLIECGYLDNTNDMNFILSNMDRVAKGIAKGVCSIYGIEYKEKEFDKEELKLKIINFIKSL